MTSRVEIFDKSPYEPPPSPMIRDTIAKLASLGKAVIAARDADGRWSANIEGTIFVGKDGTDPVLRGSPAPPGECACHIHMRWSDVEGYVLTQGNVGYGAEPAVFLVGKDGQPVIRIFYPHKTYAEVEATLAREVPAVLPWANALDYVFVVCFSDEEGVRDYIQFWKEISEIVQKQEGARGTRLRRTHVGFAVLAITTWDSKEARERASEKLNAERDIDNVVASRIADLGGELFTLGWAEEAGAVFP